MPVAIINVHKRNKMHSKWYTVQFVSHESSAEFYVDSRACVRVKINVSDFLLGLDWGWVVRCHHECFMYISMVLGLIWNKPNQL